MTAPTFAKALVLIYGAILAPGRRTITAALRVQGLEGENNFGKYHRVLNQAPWSAMVMSRLLLGLLVLSFVPEGWPLLVLIDETLERRQGKKIGYKGWFRDAVRSTANKVAVSLGIRLSLSRLNHRLPRAQTDPEVMQGTAEFHHQITDAFFPQADPVLHDPTALDAAVDMLDP